MERTDIEVWEAGQPIIDAMRSTETALLGVGHAMLDLEPTGIENDTERALVNRRNRLIGMYYTLHPEYPIGENLGDQAKEVLEGAKAAAKFLKGSSLSQLVEAVERSQKNG